MKLKIVAVGVVASLIAAIGAVSTVGASWSPSFRSSNDTVTVAKDDTHAGSLYVAGDKVTIDGTITGSLYCAASTVVINGTVEGDVLCAAQRITINGAVERDARLASQYVHVDGQVGGSLTAFAQEVRLGKDSRVAEDINGAAQHATFDGAIGRDLAIGLQELMLGGTVAGNVDAAVEKVQLGSSATVAGNFNYSAQQKATFDDSKVQGSVSFNEDQNDSRSNDALVSATKFVLLIMLVATALAVALLLPRFVHRSSELFENQMLLTSLLGFAFVFGGPVVVGLLLFSIVLIPVGLALLFAWLAVLTVSGVFFAYWVGSALLRTNSNVLVRMLGGTAIVLILYLIPVLNAFTIFVAVVVGSGMVIATLANGYRRPSYAIVEAPEEVRAPKKPAKK